MGRQKNKGRGIQSSSVISCQRALVSLGLSVFGNMGVLLSAWPACLTSGRELVCVKQA